MLKTGHRKFEQGAELSHEMYRQEGRLGNPKNRILHPGSPEFGLRNLLPTGQGGVGAGAWPSANKPIAIPFRLSAPATVVQLGWRNGSGTMTDSVDIGIYDLSWNRKVSGGGTARSGASAMQWVDVTDTFLQAGKYYLVSSNNGTTANNAYFFGTWAATLLAGLGCYDSATNAYTLPDPLTNMVAAATFTRIPQIVIACRTPF